MANYTVELIASRDLDSRCLCDISRANEKQTIIEDIKESEDQTGISFTYEQIESITISVQHNILNVVFSFHAPLDKDDKEILMEYATKYLHLELEHIINRSEESPTYITVEYSERI